MSSLKEEEVRVVVFSTCKRSSGLSQSTSGPPTDYLETETDNKQAAARGEVANGCHKWDRQTDLQTDGLQELLEWPLATKK